MPKPSAITPEPLRAWQARMGFTNIEAAEALGMSLGSYVQLRKGISRNTGYPVRIDRRTALACAAIEHGIKPLEG
jgi:hypothetical protein